MINSTQKSKDVQRVRYTNLFSLRSVIHNIYNIFLIGIILSIFINCFLRTKTSNVNVSFHRFENQDRHSVDMQMLIWLKHLESVNINDICATIPNDHTYLSYLVRPIFNLPHFKLVLTDNTEQLSLFNCKVLHFFHTFKGHFIYRCNSYNRQINEIVALK